MSSTSALIASYVAFIIGFFGFFGNVNILVAVARRKKLQSRCGLLMALIALYDTISIVFDYFQSMVFILELEFTTRKCFNAVFLFICVQLMQLITVLSVAIDRFVSIVFPVLYRTVSTRNWFIFTLIPGLFLSAVFLPWGYFTLDDQPVDGCDPPTALPDAVAIWLSRVVMIINFVTVIVYASVIAAIRVNSRRFSKSLHDTYAKNFFETQKKAMNTISSIIIVLCCTVFLTKTISLLFYDIPELVEYPWFLAVVDAASVPIMFQYSLNYYVYFWRSSEYREVFKEQLIVIFPFLRGLFDGKQNLFWSRGKVSPPSATVTN